MAWRNGELLWGLFSCLRRHLILADSNAFRFCGNKKTPTQCGAEGKKNFV